MIVTIYSLICFVVVLIINILVRCWQLKEIVKSYESAIEEYKEIIETNKETIKIQKNANNRLRKSFDELVKIREEGIDGNG